MSSDDVLLGLGLVVTLAIASQLIARRLRLPAIVVLLPAGFLAGIATEDVHPDRLLGSLFQPVVSLAVGVVLFEAGLRLSFRELSPDARRIVVRLIAVGAAVTWLGVAVAAALLFDGLGDGVPLLIGAILVVSGPTVVLPLLSFVRPMRSVRTLLMWEGVVIDPVGALLGVVVFHAVSARTANDDFMFPGGMLLGIGAGALVGLAGAALLWLLLRESQRTYPRQAVPATLMVVVAALVVADLLREDAGLVATTLMGVVLANQRRIDVSLTLEFQNTLVQLLVGVLFILIAASVSPSEVEAVLPEALLLVAAMALVVRPLGVALSTWRSPLTVRERAFVAWMAPRGVVAGATASAFGLQLAEVGTAGADRILAIIFVAIFGTVVLYGLTAGPVARRLGVAGAGGTTVLVVGGHSWARAIGEALHAAGVPVRLWAGLERERAAARAAGLDADRGRLMVDAMSREAELEQITDALVLTRSDDFNALAAAELRIELGHDRVHRVAPEPDEADLLPPLPEGSLLGGEDLTFAELSRRFDAGGRLLVKPAGDGVPAADELVLFVVARDGSLHVASGGPGPAVRPGDVVVSLAGAERRRARHSADRTAAEPIIRSG